MHYAIFARPPRPRLLRRPGHLLSACPVSPRTGGRCTPSTSIPAARRPASAPPSGARPGAVGRRPAPRGGRARPGLRSLRPVSHPGQRAPGRGLSAERRRRADPAGAVGRGGRPARSAPEAVAHGSTGAGNDQIRFDVALRVLAPELEIVTPIRDRGIKREQAIAYLERARPAGPGQGRRLLDQSRPLGHHLGRRLDPRHLGRAAGRAGRSARGRARRPGNRPGLGAGLAGRARRRAAGRPGARRGGWAICPRRTASAAASTSARPRSASRAGSASRPAPRCCSSARTASSRSWCSPSGRRSGRTSSAGSTATACTRASTSTPSLRDIEALITSSQARVTGETRVRLAAGRFQVVGTRSPHSMMDTSVATYGEENRLWTGDEARAFARVAAVPSLLAARAAAASGVD